MARTSTLRKGTNSLGWAITDCHNCQADGRDCDRQRPRCRVCINRGIHCGGYVQQLRWHVGVASRGKLNRRSLPTIKSDLVSSKKQDQGQSSDLIFVPESGVRGVKAKGLRQLQKRWTDSPAPRDTSHKDEKPLLATLDTETALDDHSQKSAMITCRSMNNIYGLSSEVAEALHFFRANFSHMPLTFSTDINPWLMCLPLAFHAPCLMDAVVAVSRRHRAHICRENERLQVLELKRRSLGTLAACLGTADLEVIVGTILALLTLDVSIISALDRFPPAEIQANNQ